MKSQDCKNYIGEYVIPFTNEEICHITEQVDKWVEKYAKINGIKVSHIAHRNYVLDTDGFIRNRFEVTINLALPFEGNKPFYRNVCGNRLYNVADTTNVFKVGILFEKRKGYVLRKTYDKYGSINPYTEWEHDYDTDIPFLYVAKSSLGKVSMADYGKRAKYYIHNQYLCNIGCGMEYGDELSDISCQSMIGILMARVFAPWRGGKKN